MNRALWTVEGLDAAARRIVGLQVAPLSFVLRLYVNSLVISDVLTLAVVEECTLAGYQPIDLQQFTWIGGQEAHDVAYRMPTLYFKLDAYNPLDPPVTIHGWYLTNYGPGQLWAIQGFDAPVVVPYTGLTIGVAVEVRLRDLISAFV